MYLLSCAGRDVSHVNDLALEQYHHETLHHKVTAQLNQLELQDDGRDSRVSPYMTREPRAIRTMQRSQDLLRAKSIC